jgi:hypothetical protein
MVRIVSRFFDTTHPILNSGVGTARTMAVCPPRKAILKKKATGSGRFPRSDCKKIQGDSQSMLMGINSGHFLFPPPRSDSADHWTSDLKNIMMPV